MSNLFGGLFEAGQKARADRAKAKKNEQKRVEREEAAAARKKAAAEELKKKKQEEKSGKRKAETESVADDVLAKEMPASKKSKLSENTSTGSSKSASKGKKSDSKTKKKQAFIDSSSDSSSGDEKSFDSDGSVLEFGSDNEHSAQLIAELQDIISGGDVPEVADEPEPSDEEEEEEEAQQEEEGALHSVFVGNLLASVSKQDLTKLVSEIEEPVQVRVLMQNRDGRQVAVSFIDFATASAAQKVVKKFNNAEFKGRKLQVRPANDRKLPPAPESGESVYVRNLSFNTTEETIRKLFSPFGEILKIRLPIFADSGKHRGYGFVDYKDSSSAKKALSINRKKVDGREILVEPAVKREAPKAEFKVERSADHLTFDD